MTNVLENIEKSFYVTEQHYKTEQRYKKMKPNLKKPRKKVHLLWCEITQII